MKQSVKLVLAILAAGFFSTATARPTMKERVDNWTHTTQSAGENLRSTTDEEDDTPPGEPNFGSVGDALLFVTLAGISYGFLLKKRLCVVKK